VGLIEAVIAYQRDRGEGKKVETLQLRAAF
jgi:hypothetical protein